MKLVSVFRLAPVHNCILPTSPLSSTCSRRSINASGRSSFSISKAIRYLRYLWFHGIFSFGTYLGKMKSLNQDRHIFYMLVQKSRCIQQFDCLHNKNPLYNLFSSLEPHFLLLFDHLSKDHFLLIHHSLLDNSLLYWDYPGNIWNHY